MKKIMSRRWISAILVDVMLLTSLFNGVKIEASYDTTAPVDVSWSRSAEPTATSSGTIETSAPWTAWDWSLAGAMQTPVTDPDGVWDSGTSQQYFKSYVPSGTNFKAATWQLQTRNPVGTGTTDLRRFTGKFTLPADFDPADTLLYRSVNQDAYKSINNGNIIPINDDIYIFCYPEGTQVSNDPTSPHYFMKYFVFWAGTSGANQGKTFHGVPSATTRYDPSLQALSLTNGWYAEADPDNIGFSLFQNGVLPQAGRKYVLDIFTDENAVGGGMDKPELLISRSNQLRVVAQDDAYVANLLHSPTPLNIVANDKVYQRDQEVVSTGITVSDFIGTANTTLTPQGNHQYAVTVGQQAAGTLFLDANGKGTFAPAEDFHGEVQFRYTAQVNDVAAVRTDTALVTIIVEDADKSALLHTDKTAQLLDWNQRLYQLNLMGWSDFSESSSEVNTPADVVLVIDRSGSMHWKGGSQVTTASDLKKLDKSKQYAAVLSSNKEVLLAYVNGAWRYDDYSDSIGNNDKKVSDNQALFKDGIYEQRMDLVKAATAEFINNLPTGSSVAITSFSKSEQEKTELVRTVIAGTAAQQKAARSKAIKAINDITPSGGTYMSGGLTEADKQINVQNPNNVVLVFSDGAVASGDEAATIAAAAALRGKARIFTIGVGEADNHFLESICTPTTPEDETIYNRPCTDMDQLAEELQEVLEDSTIVGGFSKVTVIDTIDPRFVVVDQNGAPLPDGAAVNGGILQNMPNGTQRVIWTNQNISYDKANPHTPTWEKTVFVKAKEAFIGGNAIPTNGADSQMETEGAVKPFPVPVVNVKIQMQVDDAAVTIFKGETVPMKTMTGTVSNDVFCGMPATGTFTYKWTQEDGTALPFPTHVFPRDNGFYPVKETFYTLEATFTPTVSTAGNASSVWQGNVYNAATPEQNRLSDTGRYTVLVESGTLTIVKNLQANTADTATPFVFQVKQYDAAHNLMQTFYRTVYTNDAFTGSITLTGLGKGTYEVTEMTDWTWKYEKINVTVTGSTLDRGHTHIQATFTNKKIPENWHGASDSVVNTFR